MMEGSYSLSVSVSILANIVVSCTYKNLAMAMEVNHSNLHDLNLMATRRVPCGDAAIFAGF